MFIFQRDPAGFLSPEQRVLMQAFLSGPQDPAPYRSCAYDDLGSLREETCAIPVGSVEFVRRWGDLQGLTEALKRSWPGTYPPALYPHMRRTVWQSTLDEARAYARHRPIFVKPALLEGTKVFTGQVLKAGHPCADIAGLPKSLMVWCSTPVAFTAEYRAYVVRGELVGVARYDEGPEDRAPEPDLSLIRSWIQDFSTAPAGYALDVGLLEGGETAIVEVNDGWALGYYRGISPSDYRDVIATRWEEIVALGLSMDPRGPVALSL